MTCDSFRQSLDHRNNTAEYIEKVLVPYMSEQRRLLNLEPEVPALCIVDVFAAHRC